MGTPTSGLPLDITVSATPKSARSCGFKGEFCLDHEGGLYNKGVTKIDNSAMLVVTSLISNQFQITPSKLRSRLPFEHHKIGNITTDKGVRRIYLTNLETVIYRIDAPPYRHGQYRAQYHARYHVVWFACLANNLVPGPHNLSATYTFGNLARCKRCWNDPVSSSMFP